MSEFVQLSSSTVQDYIQCLDNKAPWALSRWGDGEIRSLLSENDKCWARLKSLAGAWAKGKTNKSGHSFPPEMGEDMRALLRGRPTHRLSVAGRFTRPEGKPHEVGMGKWLKEWLVANKLGDLKWDACDMIVRTLIRQKFKPFLDAIRQQRVILVGPAHLSKLRAFKVARFVKVPRHDAYKAMGLLHRTVAEALSKATEHTVVSISMGPAAPILVEALWKFCKGEHTIIDLGSIWDLFVGESSRSYMRRPELKAYVAKLVSGS